MFTGIISTIGTIESSEQLGDLRIKVACQLPQDAIAIGDSIACNGACMTVTNKGFLASGKMYFTADVSAESVARTAPHMWEKGAMLNLERSLKVGDTLDGHLVSGHVDGVGTVEAIEAAGDSHIVTFSAPRDLARFIAEKGSVTVDGVSLTVNSIEDRAEGARFSVNIIPHTWKVTTLGMRRTGDRVNLEIDMLARYVARLMNT